MAEGRPADLRTRLARAIHSLSVQLANAPHARGGALIQVWMPNQLPDGTVVLSAQVCRHPADTRARHALRHRSQLLLHLLLDDAPVMKGLDNNRRSSGASIRRGGSGRLAGVVPLCVVPLPVQHRCQQANADGGDWQGVRQL